jgi:hypothetical protein
MAPANDKNQAHHLLDRLDAGQLSAVVHLLQVMTNPVSRAIAQAPLDEEPLSAKAIEALDQAREWSERNPGIRHEQVLAELGITQDEIERHK